MNIRNLLIILFAASLIAGPAYAKSKKAKAKSKALPPGLNKKAEKGKPLPPGWQKKLSKGDILDKSIYSRGKVVVPLGRDGSISIEVEGTIFRLHEKTRKIIDILD
ncbi:MAG TPA: hypothetical protein ENH82_04570 [bacterium]|nr:hypothetical protein [bacterium]